MTAAFHSGWPFSSELCVAYAMIISTAGTNQREKSVIIIKFVFYYRNRIDYNFISSGRLSMQTSRPETRPPTESHQRLYKPQRPFGTTPGGAPFDAHLELRPGRHLSTALRMGSLRSCSFSHKVCALQLSFVSFP